MTRADLLVLAQRIFIVNQLLNFPLYYLPGVRNLLGGDGEAKFPCSISWMTRRGLPRLNCLILWNVGWYFLVRAVAADETLGRLIFTLQMYATGFVTVVLTPMMGSDVAMGSADALHCYSAMLYVLDHWFANELLLSVPLTSAYGAGFAVTASLCGVFQFLRADDDLMAKRVHARGWAGGHSVSFDRFKRTLEVGFMLTENLLFFIFLFGMSSALPHTPAATSQRAPLMTRVDWLVVVAIVIVFTALELGRARSMAHAAAPSATTTKRQPVSSPARTRSPRARQATTKPASQHKSSRGTGSPAPRPARPRRRAT